MSSPNHAGKYAKLENKFESDCEPDLDIDNEEQTFLPKENDNVWLTNGHHDDAASDESDTPSFAGDDVGNSRSHIEGSSSNLPLGSDRFLPGETSRVDQGSSDLEMQRQQAPANLSAKQRMLNIVKYLFPVKQTYERLSNGIATGRMQANTPGRFVGQGTDGVFRNLTAKPDTELNRVMQEQHPPTYEEAAADATPEYWETTMISPMYEDEVFVQGLPVGNLANFVWNVLVTVAFQLVGFILCYLLHTSHAAKQGTRAGLGITFIMYGYSIIPTNFGHSDRIPVKYEPEDPNLIDISALSSIKSGGHVDNYLLGFQQHQDSGSLLAATKTPYFAYGLIAFGIFIIIKSIVDFYNVKQAELQILAPQRHEETHTVTDTVEDREGEEGP